MIMHLCLAMGEPSPARLLERMTLGELLEWANFWREDPWGPQRTDVGLAGVMSLLYNIHRNKGRPSIPPERFMTVPPKRPRRQQTWDEVMAVAKTMERRR